MGSRRLDSAEEVPLTGRTVGEFWQWAFSDVLTNVSRGVFAEWVVATALGADAGVRREWEPYDLEAHGIKVEVKSSALLQSW